MKKFLISVLMIFTCITIQAYGQSTFVPSRSEVFESWGVGVFAAPQKFKIYLSDSEDSRVLEEVEWNEFGVKDNGEYLQPKNIFVSFVPQKRRAFYIVDYDTDGWCRIIYDRENNRKGWVKITKDDQFYTWLELMNKYGKTNGVYLFSDMPSEFRKLYTSPADDAQPVKSEYHLFDNIKVVAVKGNWMMARLVDFDNTMHIGWIRWRTEDGKIMVFPNFSDED